MMLISGTIPPSGVNESCMPFTAPQLASVVVVAKSAVDAMPKRTSLPSMLPPGCMALVCWSTPCKQRIAASLHRVRDRDARQAQNRHGRPHRPAVPLRARHPAQRVGEAGAKREHHDDLHEIGERSGILEGMRAIGVEEAAAVRPENLDGFLRGDGPLRDHLVGDGLRRRLAVRAGGLHGLRIQELGRVVGPQILNHALRNEHQRDHQAHGQQNPQHAAASNPPRNCRWSSILSARSRESPRWPARCRRPPKRSCGRRGRPSA